MSQSGASALGRPTAPTVVLELPRRARLRSLPLGRVEDVARENMRLPLLGIVLTGLASSACELPRHPEPVPETLVFTVFGMTSAEGSVPRVEAALENVEGVASATVDYPTRTVVVHCRGHLAPELLVAALRKQGFGAAAH